MAHGPQTQSPRLDQHPPIRARSPTRVNAGGPRLPPVAHADAAGGCARGPAGSRGVSRETGSLGPHPTPRVHPPTRTNFLFFSFPPLFSSAAERSEARGVVVLLILLLFSFLTRFYTHTLSLSLLSFPLLSQSHRIPSPPSLTPETLGSPAISALGDGEAALAGGAAAAAELLPDPDHRPQFRRRGGGGGGGGGVGVVGDSAPGVGGRGRRSDRCSDSEWF